MKKKVVVAWMCLLLFGGVSLVHADLLTIGTATYNGLDYNLIFDDNNNGNSVVWLDYTNYGCFGDWESQLSWAAGLDTSLSINLYAGYSVDWETEDWRLPSAGDNVLTSEIGHLIYEELGNSGPLVYTGSFDNLGVYTDEYPADRYDDFYWTGTRRPYGVGIYTYRWLVGDQTIYDYGARGFGLAIRTGHVTTVPIPEPASVILFALGLFGFVGFGRNYSIRISNSPSGALLT